MKLANSYKGLLKSISAYTAVNIFGTALPYILLPILTKYLSPAEFGVLSNIQAIFYLVIPLVGINIAAAVSRQYVKKEIDFKAYVGTSTILITVAFVILMAVVLIFGQAISAKIQIPYYYLCSIVLLGFVHNLVEVLLAIWRMGDRLKKFAYFKVARGVFELLFSILAVVILKYGWQGRYLVILLNTILFAVVAMPFLKKQINFKYVKTYAKHFLRYGSLLIPHSISGLLITHSDKFMITDIINLENNGIYSVAVQIGMVIALLQNSVNQAWVPWFFKKMEVGGNDNKFSIVKFTYGYMLFLFIALAVLWLCTPLIYKFIGTDFIDGKGLVLIVGLSFVLNGIYKMFANYLFYNERTLALSITTVLAAALNIGLNVWLIPTKGLVGAAYASLISLGAQMLVVAIIAIKMFDMPWLLKKRDK